MDPSTDILTNDPTEQANLDAISNLIEGNKAAAARALQIDYTTLHRKLKKHGLLTMAPPP